MGKVRIQKPCVVLHGVPLFPGNTVELPCNVGHCLVDQEQAEWIFSDSQKAEVEFVAKAQKAGYKVEAPPRRLADREEFAHLKKPKKWMSGVVQETPAS